MSSIIALRPKKSNVNPDAIPQEMKDAKRWLVWQYIHRANKFTKCPLTPTIAGTFRKASSVDETTWVSFDRAYEAYKAKPAIDGIGFVLGDGWVGIDLDHRDETSIEAQTLCSKLTTYCERSPSGNGLHWISGGELDPNHLNRQAPWEWYDSGRFFTVTGDRVGDCDFVADGEFLSDIHSLMMPERVSVSSPTTTTSHCPIPDDDILDVAIEDDRFRELWRGDLSGNDDDHSRADLALISKLMYYCDGDREKADGLFRKSNMYRPKWDRKDYRDSTFAAASVDNKYGWIAHHSNNCDDNQWLSFANPPTPPPPPPPTTTTILTIQEMETMADNMKEQWLVPGWLEYGSLGMLTGHPFEGKSCMVTELIASIAQRRSFGSVDTDRCPILLIDRENGIKRQVRRLRTALCGDCSPLQGIFGSAKIAESDMPLCPDKLDYLIGRFADALTTDRLFVVIDTMRSAFRMDELDTTQMINLLYPLQSVAQDHNAAILVLHHRPKNNAHYSGSTAISGALDYLWMWQSDRDTCLGKLSLIGTRDEPQEPMEFRYTGGRNIYVPAGGTQDQLETLLPMLLDGNTLSKGELVARLRNAWTGSPPGINRLRDSIDSLVGTVLKRSGKANSGYCYSLV